jgi:hypothetical protein
VTGATAPWLYREQCWCNGFRESDRRWSRTETPSQQRSSR